MVLGVAGVYGFIMHLVFWPLLTEQIGWSSKPFQYNVAYANLTIGILGFSSFMYSRGNHLLASMVTFVSWFFADGNGYVVLLVVSHNNAYSNAGTELYIVLLNQIIVVISVCLSMYELRGMCGNIRAFE